MEEKELRVVVIDPQNPNVLPKLIKDDLKEFYKLIGCHTIDIATRKIGNSYYDIICDDEGLLVDKPLPSAVNSKGELMLVGNLIICGLGDEDGNLTSLKEDDLVNIYPHLGIIHFHDKPLFVVECEY